MAKPGTTLSTPGTEFIKLFSSSAQLSMEFQLLINVEIFKNCGKFWFKTPKLVRTSDGGNGSHNV